MVGATSPQQSIVSGLVYTYDTSQPVGSKITEVNIDGVSLNPKTIYTVSTVGILASGRVGYKTFAEGQNITDRFGDVDTLVAYVGSLPQPVNMTVDGRIQRIN